MTWTAILLPPTPVSPMALRRYLICLTVLTWLSLLTSKTSATDVNPIIIYFLTCSTVTQSVRITNLKVPHIYTLERHMEPEPLVLDCEYELGPREKGFVLKWLFNNHSIYQWIPSVKGFAMVGQKQLFQRMCNAIRNSLVN